MVCLKNLLLFVASLARIAASRLMFTTDSKSGANHVRRATAILARKNTTLSASHAQKHLGPEATGLKNALNVRLQQPAKHAAMSLKRQIINTVTIAQSVAAIYTKQSCTLVATIWLRWKEMATNVASAGLNNRLMSIILTCLGGSKSLTEKGAITI